MNKNLIPIISDLHLEKTRTLTNPLIVNFLNDLLIKGYREIFILGDLLDLYKDNTIEEVIGAWPDFFEALKLFKRVLIIEGNHDTDEIYNLPELLDCENSIGVVEDYQEQNNYFTHGHEFDPLLSLFEGDKDFIDRAVQFFFQFVTPFFY